MNFPEIKPKAENHCFAEIIDPATCVPIETQTDFGLYAILFYDGIDDIEISSEVKRCAANEWLKRYPEYVYDAATPVWLKWADTAALRILNLPSLDLLQAGCSL